MLFPGVLSTRPPGATRHVPISRNVAAVVATSRSTRRPQRKKEPLGWHEHTDAVACDRPATAAKEKKHWSGVAYGENFEQTVDQLGSRKDQSITVRLQRDASHGRSLSLEPTFDWKPDNPRADSKQQLEQCVG